jgi:hypothetical protein
MRIVSREEAKRRGWIDRSGAVKVHRPGSFSRAHPDAGFGKGRPDLDYYRKLAGV